MLISMSTSKNCAFIQILIILIFCTEYYFHGYIFVSESCVYYDYSMLIRPSKHTILENVFLSNFIFYG